MTSARDLAVLARKTFTNKVIRDVITESSYTVAYGGVNPRELILETTVKLKQAGAEGVIGGKTGTTPEAGACLVLLTQEPGGNRIITVILGSAIEFDADGNRVEESDLRYIDAEAILVQMHQDYDWIEVANGNAPAGLNEELAAWEVGLLKESEIVVPAIDGGSLTYSLQLGPEGEPDTEVGRVLFFVDAEQVAERPVVQRPPGDAAANAEQAA